MQSKHESIDFYPRCEANHLERPHFCCKKRGSTIWGYAISFYQNIMCTQCPIFACTFVPEVVNPVEKNYDIFSIIMTKFNKV